MIRGKVLSIIVEKGLAWLRIAMQDGGQAEVPVSVRLLIKMGFSSPAQLIGKELTV